MNDVKKLSRMWVGACLVCVSAVVVACGPRPPPPHVVEIPIDQFQAAPGPAPVEAAPTPPPLEVETATPEAPGGPGGHPTPIASAAPQAPAGPPPGQRLTAANCKQLIDKGAVLFGIGEGMTPFKAVKAVASLRGQASADGTFSKVQSSCAEQNTKAQMGCAMKATSFDKWKGCVE